MDDDYKTAYQYDRCSSRGICSINPATASLQEVIISYLKQAAFYEMQLREHGCGNKITNLILNTISILSSNYEISEANFRFINTAFQKELFGVKKVYEEKNISTEIPEFKIFPDEKSGINDYIRIGESEFQKRIKDLPEIIRMFYKILFILTKSICINILTVESYNTESAEEVTFILRLLNTLNYPETDSKEVKKLIINAAESDCILAEKKDTLQEKFYGIPSEREVSFSTTKGKAVLVVGSNYRELELILEELKDKNIDVYTHDNMIGAHTYPKFQEYKSLKGQFGQGMENCLLDFSTFPGPVILTRHSLFNIENLYRGRLFTTDFAYSKGVIPIRNNDFSDVIMSAEQAKGFKTGRKCASAHTGFNYENAVNLINNKLENGNYTNVFIIGIKSYTYNEEYFRELIKHSGKKVLIISLSCCKNKDNVICLNTEYDNFALYKITKHIIKNYSQKLSVFIPFCDRHTLSFIISLSQYKQCRIYLGEQDNTMINSAITNCLNKTFGIKAITSPQKDLNEITNTK